MSTYTRKKHALIGLITLAVVIVGAGIGFGLSALLRDDDGPTDVSSDAKDRAAKSPAAEEDPEPSSLASYAELDGQAQLVANNAHEASFATADLLFEGAEVAFYLPESAGELIEQAAQAGVPVLVAGGEPSAEADAELIAELESLGVNQLHTTLPAAAEGWDGEVVAVDAEAGEQLDTSFTEDFAAPQRVDVTVLTDGEFPAALAMLEYAGATILESGRDPRGEPDIIAELSENPDTGVVGLFDEENPDFDWQVETAKEGHELPGGGQLVFDGKRYVALYGSPVTEALGLLGEQGAEATIERAQAVADEYAPLTEDAVVPALEIIVTVAAGQPGPDGNYSNEWAVDTFIPLIEAAQEAGQYVVIDFQSGRSDFTSQIKLYEDLLKYPHVGVALDPEWRLGPDEVPLTRVGHVEIAEVNEAINYVADFTRENNLPQKAFVLHQFQIQMLRDLDQVDQSRSEVALLVHADGQGSQNDKALTWERIVEYVPDGIPLGWKNFIDEDTPMLTPEQTVEIEPSPHFVSYQ